ncbi:MAG: alpha/beta hydrolase [Gammaproteobacteria bacterium]|nr:MAG: alpha/beta hydrolase [Gammaproteobacteria bacterium]
MSQAPCADGYFRSADGLSLFFRDYPQRSASAATPVICLPGLTRNSEDFVGLAARLATQRRVITTDLRGRGRSEYDHDRSHYNPQQYVADVWELLALLAIDKVIVIGTSLGGLMAMIMAWQRPASVAGAVLNDIGPELDPAGLARVVETAALLPEVDTWQEAVQETRNNYRSSFPDWTESRWLDYAKSTYRETGDGRLAMNLDANVGVATREGLSGLEHDPWQLFDALLPIPLLLLRGEHSDLLSAATCEKMQQRKTDLIAVTVRNRGHAPYLDEPEATDAIDQFLQNR